MKNEQKLIAHIVAVLLTLVAIIIITWTTRLLYFYPDQSLELFEIIISLWQTKMIYYRFIVIMNFVVKPLFVYYLVIVIFHMIHRK